MFRNEDLFRMMKPGSELIRKLTEPILERIHHKDCDKKNLLPCFYKPKC